MVYRGSSYSAHEEMFGHVEIKKKRAYMRLVAGCAGKAFRKRASLLGGILHVKLMTTGELSVRARHVKR